MAGLSHTAGIDDLHVSQVEMKRNVRVSHADVIGVDRFQPRHPAVGVVGPHPCHTTETSTEPASHRRLERQPAVDALAIA